MDKNLQTLSNKIVNYSINVKEDEKVLIITTDVITKPLIQYLIKDIVKNKGIPFVRISDTTIGAFLLENTTDKRMTEIQKQNQYDVENFDAFITIRYINNDYETKNIHSDLRKKMGKLSETTDDIRINKRKWVLLNYPSHLDAYKAKMTNEEFFQFSFDVMNIDYKEIYEMMRPLKELMEKTDKVRIVTNTTDISFSIKGMNAIPCAGQCNLPDGEVYTAPIKDSVNGKIVYNTPSPYQGNIFHNIELTFKNGQIIDCNCLENKEKLEEIFNTDDGAKYIGEFAIGLNPLILNPMGDILYDEKIIGSIHFTPGRCYKDADNGNISSIHWDLVLIERLEYGGGQLYFDDTLIRENGLFVIPELKHLNYNLK